MLFREMFLKFLRLVSSFYYTNRIFMYLCMYIYIYISGIFTISFSSCTCVCRAQIGQPYGSACSIGAITDYRNYNTRFLRLGSEEMFYRN